MCKKNFLKQETLQKEIVYNINQEVKSLLTLSFFDKKEGHEKKAVIEVALKLGHDEIALNLISNL